MISASLRASPRSSSRALPPTLGAGRNRPSWCSTPRTVGFMVLYIYIYTYTHIHIYIYIHICICTYTYIYIYILKCSHATRTEVYVMPNHQYIYIYIYTVYIRANTPIRPHPFYAVHLGISNVRLYIQLGRSTGALREYKFPPAPVKLYIH